MDLSTRAEERIIDGVNYRCWPLPFGQGRPLLVRAFKAVAPAFAAAFRGGASGEAGMAGALEAIAEHLDDSDVEKFARSFGDAASYWGEKKDGEGWIPLVSATQNLHFAGRYDAFFQWLIFAMEVNGFARFFNTLKDEAGSVRDQPDKTESPPSSPTSP